MSPRPLIAFLLALALSGSAMAQMPQQRHHGAGPPTAHTPYACLQERSIKALSDQQISELRAGRGMGLALAAELNGYPGPLHALELADELSLSPDQRSSIGAALNSMKSETGPIGERVITGETELDRLFASRKITLDNLDAAVMRIAAAQGELRAAHLRYHLLMTSILSPEQATKYARLRGYSSSQPGPAAPQ